MNEKNAHGNRARQPRTATGTATGDRQPGTGNRGHSMHVAGGGEVSKNHWSRRVWHARGW